MKVLMTGIFTTLFFINHGQAHALQTRTVYSQDAQGIQGAGIELKVWSGYGLTINFIPANEIIKEVWIGDPTHFVFSSNGNLCQKNDLNEGDSCQNSPKDATVLFVRQIKKIDFPNVLSSQDGGTQLTIITESTAGQKQYQFRLGLASGEPAYTSLIIKSDSEKPAPLLLRKNSLNLLRKHSGTRATQVTDLAKTERSSPHYLDVAGPHLKAGALALDLSVKPSLVKNDADVVACGLAVAVLKGEIKHSSSLWQKAQDAIQQLRYGKSVEDAINLTGVPTSIFKQLIQWGEFYQ